MLASHFLLRVRGTNSTFEGVYCAFELGGMGEGVMVHSRPPLRALPASPQLVCVSSRLRCTCSSAPRLLRLVFKIMAAAVGSYA